MAYISTSTRTTKSSDTQTALGRSSSLYGVFLGFIKQATDVQRNGRLMVWIPEFGSAPDNPSGWTLVNYCSPFAGATNVDTISKTDTHQFDQTQTSYGMWMVPPDVNNEVLIMFINGDPSRGVWIGCLYNQFMNNMVPGMAADAKNWEYPGKIVPVAEYNKWDTSVTEPDRAIKPFEKTKFRGVSNQGLINDRSRGTTTSSARREAPSNVFGIITPGPVIDPSVTSDKFRRKGGSSFIMDDGTGTEYIQLTTKTGAQIRLDETNGFVYLLNRDGTAWVQMDQKGNIDIFSAVDISLRGQRDVNIRADRNINMEAGQNIYMKAAKDTIQETTVFTYDVNNVPKTKTIPVWNYKGEGKGDGGNIVMQALNNWHSTTKNSAFLTVIDNNMDIDIGNAFSLTTISAGQDYNSKLGIKMSTAAAFDIVATGNIRVGSNGSISVVGISDITVCADADISIKSSANIRAAAGSDILLESMTFGVTANTLLSGTLGVVGLTSIAGGLSAGGTINLGTAVSVSPPPSANPGAAEAAMTAGVAKPAEVKQLTEKINILATWIPTVTYPTWKPNTAYAGGAIVVNNSITYIANNKGVPAAATFNAPFWTIFIPEDKFKRKSEALQTTVSRFPTYEPCPEHETFSFGSIGGYTPKQTEAAKTYNGSSGPGSSATSSPLPDTTPGANNKDIPPTPADESAVTKDFNMAAYQCQLKINEGVKYTSYNDSRGLPTGGIGHLLRTNEISKYPVPSTITEEQVNAWFQADSPVSISGAQRLLGIDTWGNLSDVRKRACADLCYNMGEGGLSKFKNFLSAMKAGDYNAAGAALRDSGWFNQVGQRGPRIISMIVNNTDPSGCDKKFPG
jgi:GH24 family phage-related lysozyme (muramidase)